MQSARSTTQQVLTIYLNENDQWHGRALHIVIMERLKAEGLAGATVVRGIAGFGTHGTIRRETALRLSPGLPVRIEVVEKPETISRAREWIEPMVSEGMVMVRDIQVSRLRRTDADHDR